MSRDYTNRIYHLIENECLDTKELAKQLLMWLSESDAKEFYLVNDYGIFFENEDEEDDSE